MPTESSAADDVIYHGLTGEGDSAVIVVEDADGEQIGIVRHLPKHSPTGLNWGYTGAGPSDTARSLLISVLGADALCPKCRGTSRVVYVGEDAQGTPIPEEFDPGSHQWTGNGWQCECDGGYRRLPYPKFAEEFVSHWDAQWVMTRSAILDWLSAAQAD